MANERIEKFLDQIRVNEQIERLAKQAGCTIDRLGYGKGNLEKFAELIIKECIEQCSYTPNSNDEWDKGVKWSAEQIAEHFGVEE